MEIVREGGWETVKHRWTRTGFRRSFASEGSLAVTSAVAADSIA